MALEVSLSLLPSTITFWYWFSNFNFIILILFSKNPAEVIDIPSENDSGHPLLEDPDGFLCEEIEEAIKRSLQEDNHTAVAIVSDAGPSGISLVEDVIESDNMTVSISDTVAINVQ